MEVREDESSFQVLAGEPVPVTRLQEVYDILAELGIVVTGGYRCVLYGWEDQAGRPSWRPKAGASLGEGVDPSRAAKSLIARAGATGAAGLYRLASSPTRSMLKYEIEAVAVFPFTIHTSADEKRFVLYLDVLSSGEKTLDEERVTQLGKILRGLLSLGGGAIAALLEVEADRKRRDRSDRPFRGDYSEIVGRSEAITRVLSLVDRVASTDFSVLILGETGTGKELIARALHANSPRKSGPFEALNCGTLPEKLAESTLFGHIAGAFTDAREDHRGVFELAHKGTLFLDEIAELTLDHQTKLLRVLEVGKVRPIGAEVDRAVDVRVISATNRDLRELVERGLFRSDLYHRIAPLHIELPPLRERREDIPELIRHFLAPSQVLITPAALTRLASAPWDGNIRELRNKIEVLARLSLNGSIDLAELDFLSLGPRDAGGPAQDWQELWRRTERDFILRLITESDAATAEDVARLLGKSRSWLYEKAKEHDIKVGELLSLKSKREAP